MLGVMYITSRLLYIICYLADWAALRSIVWFAGLALIVAFFVVYWVHLLPAMDLWERA
jgi:uncharacterized MAPEG superfamily protein